jgi:TatD DNase family protein
MTAEPAPSPTPPLALYDAHNHLQDPRLTIHRARIFATLEQENVVRMVVNGSTEEDWPDVLALAHASPRVLPSFGYHPWYVSQCSTQWQERLLSFLDQVPAAVGEIGLDRWIPSPNLPEQEKVFLWQWRLASKRNLPVSIHCLRAWGRLYELLQQNPGPACGFLLHSYGGPVEMIAPLAKLGAYFSFPGFYAHERKERQRATFQQVPQDRLLIETDAPDQLPPQACIRHALQGPEGQPIHHPANLRAVYEFAAQMLRQPVELLSHRIAANFNRLFAAIAPASANPGSSSPSA